MAEGHIPEDCKRSILLPVFKGKGDPLVCGSYRAIKLLEHGMKVLERVLEKRMRAQVEIDEMQFGVCLAKVQQMQEKHQERRKRLYYAFVDLEKAFERLYGGP